MKIIKHNNFKHYKNINSILEKTGISYIFKSIEYYIAGGFPTALLFAPREENDLTVINSGYYSDIDLFFLNQNEYHKAIEEINSLNSDPRSNFNFSLISDTENASTYNFYYKDLSKEHNSVFSTTIQLVKKITGDPLEILKTFDIVNCSVMFSLNKNEWYIHNDYISMFINKKIRLTTYTPMLEKTYESYPDSIFFQLERIAKYSKRYDLELDVNSLIKLLKINNELPDLSFEENKKVKVRGYYSIYSTTITNTFSVWEAFKHLFEDNTFYYKIKNNFILRNEEIVYTDTVNRPF